MECLSSTVGASAIMGKNYSDNLHSIEKTCEKSHSEQMFGISDSDPWRRLVPSTLSSILRCPRSQLRPESLPVLSSPQSDEIFGVSHQLGKFSMETVIWSMMKKSSDSRMQKFMFSQIMCYVLER